MAIEEQGEFLLVQEAMGGFYLAQKIYDGQPRGGASIGGELTKEPYWSLALLQDVPHWQEVSLVPDSIFKSRFVILREAVV